MINTDLGTMSTNDLRELLDAGCAAGENRFHAAAIHLLDFAGLLDRASVRAHIEVASLTDDDGTRDRAAWIDWAELARAEDLAALGGAQDRLLRLAVSIARTSIPVELHDALSGLGDAHARAVLTAMALALGIADDIEINDTPAYLERRRDRDRARAELLGE